MKEVVIGITGGIAAYKVIDVISSLNKKGIGVTCVVTPSALNFVTKISLETISGRAVISDMFDCNKSFSDVEHVSLADKADLALIAPASANTIAKLALGIADNFLTTFMLAVTCPVILAPSMNDAMWNNAVTQKNILALIERGYNIIEPGEGHLACGKIGQGRFPSQEIILNKVIETLNVHTNA
ncbi:MAG: flavoprotein [Elusimicrobiota bacterium]